MLLDLLSSEEAAGLGTEVYVAHAQRMRMKRFLLKLGIAYKHQPAYHVKVDTHMNKKKMFGTKNILWLLILFY